jgi:predicted RNA polymerase sigma factor
MRTFIIVRDDEVTKIDRNTLVQKKLLSPRIKRSKQRAKAAVVEFKLRDRKRKANG